MPAPCARRLRFLPVDRAQPGWPRPAPAGLHDFTVPVGEALRTLGPFAAEIVEVEAAHRPETWGRWNSGGNSPQTRWPAASGGVVGALPDVDARSMEGGGNSPPTTRERSPAGLFAPRAQ